MRDYQRAYQSQLNRVAQQFGSMPTQEQALAMGIPGQVLGQLAADAALTQLAKSLGVGVSDARLARMLREDPNFAGTLGQFDRESFTRTLQLTGYTENDYFALQTNTARRQQLDNGLFADLSAPQAAIELVSRYIGDERTIDYFVLNAESLPDVPVPTEEDLAAYLAEHQADFRTEETRTVDVLVLSPEALADAQTVSEEEIAAEYERRKPSLSTPEQRTVQQVVLTSDAEKAAFEEGLAAGKTLEQLAQENGATVLQLGTMTKSQITDPTLADAAFSVAEGSFAIIPGAAGPRAVGVSKVVPGATPTLEEQRDKITQDLKVAAARNSVLDVLDQIEELRAAFKPLSEIGERFNLPVTEVTLTASGAALSAVPNLAEADRAKVAQAIFAAEEGKLPPTIALASTSDAWFDLKSVAPARDQTLDEVRDEVAAAWTAEKASGIAKETADKIVAELKAGKSLEEVAEPYMQFPALSQPISRSGDGTPVIDQAVASAVFAGPSGHFGAARNGEGDYVIFQVVDIVPPAEPNQQVADYVAGDVRDTVYSDFVSAVRNDYGVHENPSAISQILSVDGQ